MINIVRKIENYEFSIRETNYFNDNLKVLFNLEKLLLDLDIAKEAGIEIEYSDYGFHGFVRIFSSDNKITVECNDIADKTYYDSEKSDYENIVQFINNTFVHFKNIQYPNIFKVYSNDYMEIERINFHFPDICTKYKKDVGDIEEDEED